MGVLRHVVFQQPLMVRDDQHAHMRSGEFRQPLAHHAHRIAVESRIGFVENRKLRLQHGELQDFHPLLLAAGEAFIEVPAGELFVDIEFLHGVAKFLAEVAHLHEFFPFLAVGIPDIRHCMPQEVGDPHAGIVTGYWKARNSPSRARSQGSSSLISVPLTRIRPSVTSYFG